MNLVNEDTTNTTGLVQTVNHSEGWTGGEKDNQARQKTSRERPGD